jgi:hypothetical protein
MPTEIKLVEALAPTGGRAVGKKWRAKIIAADTWGSSAYYPTEVLERDGARVITTGLHMYADHPSQDDEWNRPERSIKDLVGTLTSDAAFELNEAEGPGLYADVEFYDSFANDISEKHKDVGLSIRATGLTEDAEMDGRYGPVLTALLAADSVDVVTKAGAGGKLTSILESDRSTAGTPIPKESKSMTDVTKEDFDTFASDLKATLESFTNTLAEAIKPKESETVVVETPTVETPVAEAAQVDDAALLTAFTEAALPVAALATVREAVVKGATIEDAIKAQTDLREAFLASAGETGVVIKESEKPLTGLARSVAKLNG